MLNFNEFRAIQKRSYETVVHFNGGRPYKIVVDTGLLKIYKAGEEEEYKELTKSYEIVEYWEGFDNVEGIHGNTFLCYLGKREIEGKEDKHKYVYVSSKITEFLTEERIDYFSSPMGNSDVPYPIAYSKNNIYLLYEVQFVKKEEIPKGMWSNYCNFRSYMGNPWHSEEASSIFYGHKKDCWENKPLKVEKHPLYRDERDERDE